MNPKNRNKVWDLILELLLIVTLFVMIVSIQAARFYVKHRFIALFLILVIVFFCSIVWAEAAQNLAGGIK